MDGRDARGKFLTSTRITVTLGMSAIALVLGFIIGFSVNGLSGHDSELLRIVKHLTKESSVDDRAKELLQKIDRERIYENLRILTQKPRLAGTSRDYEVAKYIHGTWTDQGLENVTLVPYNILLSYPDKKNPNKVQLMAKNGSVMFTSAYMEKELVKGEFSEDAVHAFNAFSPNGSVRGDLVYVNYGRIEDFEKLEELKINVTGMICISRYGKIFRGNKVQHAQERGAVGIILFSDPMDVAQKGTQQASLYPNTLWLPGSGIQRGSLVVQGDALTPYWPSIDGAYRIPVEEAFLPKIPCQPIGYNDAKIILRSLSGPLAPDDWIGGISNITYRLGPGFSGDHKDWTVGIEVNNQLEKVVTYNVIAQITGEIEPDRYVFVGNHRDTWVNGALDASSGTAPFLEVTRVLGESFKEGWRPRRSIVFSSWGAEEFGLIGSIEWVEEKVNKLMERAVAHVNMDSCARGQVFDPRASPFLEKLVIEASKKVDDVRKRSKSLFSAWHKFYVERTGKISDIPRVPVPGSGSDHAPFMFYAGIPAVVVKFAPDKYNGSYPAYHTAYDTFNYVTKFIDEGSYIMQGCGRMTLLLSLEIAESQILPLDVVGYVNAIKNTFDVLKCSKAVDELASMGLSLDTIENELNNLTAAADFWEKDSSNINLMNPIEVRMLNDQIMMFDKLFIIPSGLPGRPNDRHAIFSQSKFNAYGSSGFPGIVDLLFEYHRAESKEKKEEMKKEIEKHLSDIYIIFHRAADFLKSFGQI